MTSVVQVDKIIRENAYVESRKKHVRLRITKEAKQELISRIINVWVPNTTRYAAERATRRGSKTIQLQDVLDCFDLVGD